jgi:hypothetical protein
VTGLLRLNARRTSLPGRPAQRARGHRGRERVGAALRRSELVVGDVTRVPDEGLLLTIAHSKTDQQGQGQRVAGDLRQPRRARRLPEAALDA